MCGENLVILIPRNCEIGSPPRVRGKHLGREERWCKLRITPACAGKTGNIFGLKELNKDHPRVCGENGNPDLKVRGILGSPPRVRGKLVFRRSCMARVRITPACAGKTSRSSAARLEEGDHPRVCGENPDYRSRDIKDRGSPPRVRGKLEKSYNTYIQDRITPACAGKTVYKGVTFQLREDHPRVCGENTLEMAYFRG